MTKLDDYMHSTKIASVFEYQGQKSKVKVTGDEKRKSAAFCSGVVLSGAVLVLRFFGSGPLGRGYASGKISACCLVSNVTRRNANCYQP